jgi:hypothetical protein
LGNSHGAGPNAGVTITWTKVSGTLRIVASRVAHRTAFWEYDDPSTPTRTPKSLI